MRRIAVIPLLVLAACKGPPIAAPETIDNLFDFLFVHLEDGEDAEMEEGADLLVDWMDEHLDETKNGYKVDNLDQEGVDALGEGEQDLSSLAGAAVGHESVNTVDALVSTTATVSSVDLYQYESFERDYQGDVDAFLAHDDPRLDTEIRASSSYAGIITVETHSQVQYRWVNSKHGPALFERTWLLDPCVVTPEDIVAVDQQYFLWGIVPNEDGSSRNIQVTWVVAEVFLDDMPEDTAIDLMIGSMAGMAKKLDAYIEREGG